jgi:hypothetical protein
VVVAIDRDAWARGQTESTNSLSWRVMGTTRFKIEQFERAIEDLRTLRRDVLWQVFLPVILSGDAARGLDWFDDERWRVAIANVEVMAQIAAAGGAKGFLFDPEDYAGVTLLREAPPSNPLRRDALRGKARQRGREAMGAIARHVPDAMIVSLYGHSLVLKHKGSTPREFELVGPFLDGVVETMSGNSIFVDGFEYSYGFKKREQFVAGAREIRELGERVTEVGGAFRRRVRPGFGLWIDFRAQLNHWSPAEFATAVGEALDVSGTCVWIYGHTVRFFPPDVNADTYGRAIRKVRAERGL